MDNGRLEKKMLSYMDTCFEVLGKNIENYINEHSIPIYETELDNFIKYITNNVMNTSYTIAFGVLNESKF